MSDTPLHDAAESGDLDKARELLETGKYNVNTEDSLHWGILHCKWLVLRGT